MAMETEGEGEYATWSRAELIAALRQATAAAAAAAATGGGSGSATKPARPPKPEKPFDFSRYAFRKIALKVAYLGWPYYGLASQDHTDETVEVAAGATLVPLAVLLCSDQVWPPGLAVPLGLPRATCSRR